MKPEPTSQKIRGGYYTPKPIADFLTRWAIQSPTTRILEPSCGDGVFLESAVEVLMELGASKSDIARLIHGVEADEWEAAKAERRLRALGVPLSQGQIHAGDFFAYCRDRVFQYHLFDLTVSQSSIFDAVIGNPPFIRYQNFPESYRQVAFDLMRYAGLHPNRLTNSWAPFLVASTLLLNDHGRLAMVIPAELFQVNYAAEIRRFLSNWYRRITLITFQRLIFGGIQQEVVLLLGERNNTEYEGIRTIELNGIEDLSSFSFSASDLSNTELKPMDHSTEKWTQYFLDKEEILLLRALKASPKLTRSGEVIRVDVGVVTGENSFFILREQDVQWRSLESYTRPIVTRTAHLQGAIFTKTDLCHNVRRQFPTFLLSLPDVPLEDLPEPARAYLSFGEQMDIPKGFKCRNRKRWYIIPSVWTPDAFILRQVYTYPKLVLNETDATSTDTIHRVRFVNGVNRRAVTAAFVNSLTLAFSEVTGRSYGGGVLTFEPSESERLPLPLIGAENLDFDQIDDLLRDNNINAVLDITDEVLLIEGLGLSMRETKLLRGIWQKLRDRRINRK